MGNGDLKGARCCMQGCTLSIPHDLCFRSLLSINHYAVTDRMPRELVALASSMQSEGSCKYSTAYMNFP